MITRPFHSEDYPLLTHWWRAHGWPPVPAARLPLTARFVLDGSAPRAYAAAYQDHPTGVAMITWIVANPANTPRQTYRALHILIPALQADLVRDGFPIILTTAAHPALERLFLNHKFQVAGRNYAELIYIHGT